MLVHFGWVGSPVPEHVVQAVENARSVATGCEVILHADESIVPERWRSRLIPHMRSDVLRHVVLREYGGLWLDADVRLIASPVDWASEWDRYTAVMFGTRMIGTDIIYVPKTWDGWQHVERYMDEFFGNPLTAIRLDALASHMIQTCRANAPDAFTVLPDGFRFASRLGRFTADSVVARGFAPPAARPGLGDMVADGLAAVGITKERVQAVASKVGIKDCGCSKRQAALNRVGQALGLPPGRAS